MDSVEISSSHLSRAFTLPNLRKLVFFDCKQVSIDGSIKSYSDLTQLIMSESSVESIDENCLSLLPQLTQFTLDHRPVEWILKKNELEADGDHPLCIPTHLRQHYLRFHVSPEYQWLRTYLTKEKPSLISKKSPHEQCRLGYQALSSQGIQSPLVFYKNKEII